MNATYEDSIVRVNFLTHFSVVQMCCKVLNVSSRERGGDGDQVMPTLALASTGAAFCSKNSATSWCPARDAMWRGVSTFCTCTKPHTGTCYCSNNITDADWTCDLCLSGNFKRKLTTFEALGEAPFCSRIFTILR